MGQRASTKKRNICVIGAGHVGLVTAAFFADMGQDVLCVDSDKKKVQALNKLQLPFYEPDLLPLVKKNVKRKKLRFSFLLSEGIRKSSIIFIAVGTPSRHDGSADLTALENVARTVADNLGAYKVIVEKSTVPVQTGQKLKETIQRYKKKDVSFDVASNPEFLREGKAVYDSFHPDRIVIGVESKKARAILEELYASLKAPLVITDINTAELIKHASNSFLATKISFINAVARTCDLAGADVTKVTQAMGADKRIGKEFLGAGIGYGGSCFPKDVEAFIAIAKKLGYDFNLLSEVKKINEEQRHYFVEKIKEHLWILKDKKIAVLGLSFKPDTDDMRCAPSLDIIHHFLREGAALSLFDPQAMEEAKKILLADGSIRAEERKCIEFVSDPYAAVTGADCVCFLTEWDWFKKLDFKKIKKLMRYFLVADGRNMFEKEKLISLGFEYIGIGR